MEWKHTLTPIHPQCIYRCVCVCVWFFSYRVHTFNKSMKMVNCARRRRRRRWTPKFHIVDVIVTFPFDSSIHLLACLLVVVFLPFSYCKTNSAQKWKWQQIHTHTERDNEINSKTNGMKSCVSVSPTTILSSILNLAPCISDYCFGRQRRRERERGVRAKDKKDLHFYTSCAYVSRIHTQAPNIHLFSTAATARKRKILHANYHFVSYCWFRIAFLRRSNMTFFIFVLLATWSSLPLPPPH